MPDHPNERHGHGTQPSTGGGSLASTTQGGKNNNTPPTPITTTVIGVAAQTFRVTCTGLKPNTLHKAFLVNTDVSIDCAPISNSSPYVFGSNLVTNASGYLQFDYAFAPQTSPFQTQTIASTNQVIAIIPAGNQAFKVSSADGSSHAASYIISKGTVSG